MRTTLARIAGSLAFTSVIGCGQAPTEPLAQSQSAVGPTLQLVSLVNEHRVSVGCSRLEWHEGLSSVARAHSRDMVTRDFFGHVNPAGQSPFDRMRAAGIRWQGAAAENLAEGSTDPRTVLRGWLASTDHRLVLEDCRYTHHGLGLVSARWTHLFVTNPSG